MTETRPPRPDPRTTSPDGRPRARGLGIPFAGSPGPLNAITDVAGVEVGHVTLIRGEGPLRPGEGPVRTGVTAILPRGRAGVRDPVFAAVHALNGCGEMTGSHWIAESGLLEGPVVLTNTLSAGVARDGALRWLRDRAPGMLDRAGRLAVAAETNDAWLNDMAGFHVTAAHVAAALDGARPGAVAEGSVGGGTGMICYGFKGGAGTASRRIAAAGETWTLGVFVQANFGRRDELAIAGVPVGRILDRSEDPGPGNDGSIIVVAATDAPLLPHQLRRIAQRAGLGVGRSGGIAANGSGDIFLAFSTANPGLEARNGRELQTARFLPLAEMDPLFRATIEATDEAIVNALVVNETMTGRDGHTVEALPHDRVRAALAAHGRLADGG